MFEAGTHQILMRRNAEHARKLAQEMEGADAGLIGGIVQIDLALGICLDPERRFNGAAAVPRARLCGLAQPPGYHLDESAGEQLANLVEADIAATVDGSLRKLSEHHQFGQWRRGADAPGGHIVPDHFDEFGSQKERQALVAADVIVGAEIFIAGIADQDRSRHQVEAPAAAAAAEAALAHIGNRMTAILLDKRLVVRSGRATEVGRRNQPALQQGRSHHRGKLAGQARRSNRKQDIEQGPDARAGRCHAGQSRVENGVRPPSRKCVPDGNHGAATNGRGSKIEIRSR